MIEVAPAGWYPSPDGAPVHRWWDGSMWTDATHPSQLSAPGPAASGWPAPPPPRLGAWAVVTQVFVALAGVAAPLAATAMLVGASDPPGWLTTDVVSAIAGAAAGLMLLAGFFWGVWQYRVASTFPPGTPRRTPGWQVLSWLVPVGAWWLPYQNVADLLSLATGRRPRWLAAWWTLWVAGTALAALTTLQPWLGLAGGLLLAGCAPFAWLVVVRLTQARSGLWEQHGA